MAIILFLIKLYDAVRRTYPKIVEKICIKYFIILICNIKVHTYFITIRLILF